MKTCFKWVDKKLECQVVQIEHKHKSLYEMHHKNSKINRYKKLNRVLDLTTGKLGLRTFHAKHDKERPFYCVRRNINKNALKNCKKAVYCCFKLV